MNNKIRTFWVADLQRLNNIITEVIGFLVLGEKAYNDYLYKSMKGIHKHKIEKHGEDIKRQANTMKTRIIDDAKKYDIYI